MFSNWCSTDKFDFYSIEDASAIWGPTILFLFTLFVTFVLVNFFITIVIEAFVVVKFDISKQSNDYEVVDYMVDKFKAYTGMGQPKGRRKPPPRSNIMGYNPNEYVDGKSVL